MVKPQVFWDTRYFFENVDTDFSENPKKKRKFYTPINQPTDLPTEKLTCLVVTRDQNGGPLSLYLCRLFIPQYQPMMFAAKLSLDAYLALD